MKRITYRFWVLLFVTIFGLGFSMPSFFDTKGAKITLGLDLQGGLHMLLGVETKEAIKSKLKSVASGISYSMNKEDIINEGLRADDESIEVTLLDVDDIKKLDLILSDIKGLDIVKNELSYSITLSEAEKVETEKFAILQAVETIRNRLDLFGLAEPTVARQGEDKILVELPGIKSAQDEQRAKDLIAKSAHLQLMHVDKARADQANRLTKEQAAAYGDVILPDVKNPEHKYLIKELPILDGSMLTDAKVGFSDQNNQPVIHFSLNAEGGKIFGDFTGKNVGHQLAIVLDGKVYSAPRINERIGGGSGQISGSFTVEEASDLAIALRSGALLAPVKLLEKRSVGPSLGADSIEKSMYALIGVFVMTICFMFFYYGLCGIFADLALILNATLLVAVMALFGATLTLPGMAGIILTIGMAVDANVIINERIREALREGIAIRKSVEDGYQKAMTAILDSNLTTLITSAALYAYGTGTIKGFAVTMGIGIAASMITAIIGTHALFDYFMPLIEKSKNTRLWFGYRLPKGVTVGSRKRSF